MRWRIFVVLNIFLVDFQSRFKNIEIIINDEKPPANQDFLRNDIFDKNTPRNRWLMLQTQNFDRGDPVKNVKSQRFLVQIQNYEKNNDFWLKIEVIHVEKFFEKQ